MKEHSILREFAVGLWVVLRILLGAVLILSIVFGLVYLYHEQPLARSIMNWTMVTVGAAFILLMVGGGIVHMGDVELQRREREKPNE